MDSDFDAQMRAAWAAVDRFDEALVRDLSAVAKATAERIKVGYQQRLRSQTHGTGKTADSARVLDESDEQQFTVNVPGDPERPANLPRWLEFGTRYMTAKPALRPAADAETERYRQEMTATVEKSLKASLKVLL